MLLCALLAVVAAVTFKDFNTRNFPPSDTCPPGTADPQWSSSAECCCHGGSCLEDCCAPCQLGEFCPGDCRRYPCPAGTYQDEISQPECKMCPVMREMRDLERQEDGGTWIQQSSTALRLIFYEQDMVGATSLEECRAAECWQDLASGFRTNRNCSASTGVTTVEPPVCTAAHGKPLCCCNRVWEHPLSVEGPAPMEIAYETCGHMELDLRPDLSKYGKGRRLGCLTRRASLANTSRRLDRHMKKPKPRVKPATGPHRYEFIEDYRIPLGEDGRLGWEPGNPRWQEVGAGGYMEFTFYFTIEAAPVALGGVDSNGEPLQPCAKELLLQPPTVIRFELNRPLPACVEYPVPAGAETWKSTGKYLHIKECSNGVVYADGWCDSTCELSKCQYQGLSIYRGSECHMNKDHGPDWPPHLIDIQCAVYPCSGASRALLAAAALWVLS